MSPDPIDPHTCALLVMDYQTGILARVADPDGLLERARETITAARAAGVTVGYVRVAFADGEKPGGAMAARIPDEMLAAMHADAPGTQIDDRVAPRDGDVVVRKTRVGPFGTTDLDAQLDARGIDTLLLAGISTSGVTLSAVRDAHDRDYRVIVISDLCADPDSEIHDFLLERIFPRQGEVIDSGELARRLR